MRTVQAVDESGESNGMEVQSVRWLADGRSEDYAEAGTVHSTVQKETGIFGCLTTCSPTVPIERHARWEEVLFSTCMGYGPWSSRRAEYPD